MDAASEIEEIAAQAEKNSEPVFQGDYVGKDGLLYCGRCHTRKRQSVRSEKRRIGSEE